MSDRERVAVGDLESGRIVSAHGRRYRVATPKGETLDCFPRGKKSELAVGDRVHFSRQSPNQGVIVECLPRQTLLYRSDAFRQKLIAANATQIVVVVATEPGFSLDLVTRCLVAAESQKMRALIVLNKCDLLPQLEATRALLSPIARLGTPIIELSARTDVAALLPAIARETNVLVGQSGMGKSTIINGLVPDAKAETRDISTALGTGKHTTTQATFYPLNDNTSVIDSPGLQAFGLAHLDRQLLTECFVDFQPYLGDCRFRDCRHREEPDCAILGAVSRGLIDRQRIESYYRLCDELRT
jgi:ribosome biogenesis GTPase